MSAAELDLQVARTIQNWISGRNTDIGRVFFAEPHAAASLAAVLREDDVAIVTAADADAVAGYGASVVGYGGDLREVGDELFVSDRRIELLDYVAAGFVEILGPTVVRFMDKAGWSAFIDDVDIARRTGVFPGALVDPKMQLADREALVAPFEEEPPRSLHLREDGRVALGAQGIDLGDDLVAATAQWHPRLATLGGIAPLDDIANDLCSRPWLARCVRAGDLTKMLRLDLNIDRISGFGWSIVDDGLADAEPVVEDPLIVTAAGEFILASPTTLRRQRLSETTAAVVEIVQTSSATDLAASRISAQLAVSELDARRLCEQAHDRLDIHPGHASLPAAQRSPRL
ncbi:MAG: daptide biosynthesis RiPP recognition protein [Microbacterium sp.]